MEDLNKKMLTAAFDGDLTTVEKLVSRGADINYIDAWGNFAMFTAAWEGNIEALDLFYSIGAKITFDNANLLCNAAYNGKPDSVKMLLDAGAEPSVKDVNGDTPISWGSWHLRDADVLRLLLYDGVPGIR